MLWAVKLWAAPNDLTIPDNLDSLLAPQSSSFFSWGGYVKNETAYRFDEPRSFTKIRNILSLHADYSFGKRGRILSSGWAYYDHVYDLFPYETIAARFVRDEAQPPVFVEDLDKYQDNKVVDIRELFLELYLNKIDLKIGRQYVIWGVLEGIRIVDEINPMDFRELILPELLDYRIPLWTFKANIYSDNGNFEFLLIPDLSFHKPAPGGSEWELFQVLEKTTVPDWKNPAHREYGAKWTKRLKDADFSFSYFYTWDDYPTTFRVISAESLVQPQPVTELAILPTYIRNSIYGMTMTREIGGDILKFEFAYVTGKYFAITDKDDNGDGFLDSDGEFSRSHVRWGLGYDFSKWGADFSPAIAQWVILDYTRDILTDQFDTTLNLFVRKPMRRHSGVFTLLFIYLMNFKEIYAKPKFTFHVTDNLQLATGVDYFIGRRTQFGRASSPNSPGGLIDLEQRAQFFGNFKENRRIFVEFKYDF